MKSSFASCASFAERLIGPPQEIPPLTRVRIEPYGRKGFLEGTSIAVPDKLLKHRRNVRVVGKNLLWVDKTNDRPTTLSFNTPLTKENKERIADAKTIDDLYPKRASFRQLNSKEAQEYQKKERLLKEWAHHIKVKEAQSRRLKRCKRIAKLLMELQSAGVDISPLVDAKPRSKQPK